MTDPDSGSPFAPPRRPLVSATVRFYAIFALVLLALVWISYETGYRAGTAHARHAGASRP